MAERCLRQTKVEHISATLRCPEGQEITWPGALAASAAPISQKPWGETQRVSRRSLGCICRDWLDFARDKSWSKHDDNLRVLTSSATNKPKRYRRSN
jgi:hypothetical protein